MANSKAEKALLLRFNITQIVQIRLTKLKVYTFSKKVAKPYKCHLCKYSSKYKCSVKIHLRSHTGEKPFSCTLCTYICSNRPRLNMHIRTHTGEKPWNCAFCKKSFTQKGYKTRHENTCKLNPRQSDPSWVEMQRAFKCQFCPYSTAQKYDLKRHVIIHTGEKQFPCNICHEMFSSQNNLRYHIFAHTREKPYSCQFCPKGFVHGIDQKRHENICKMNPKQADAEWVEEQKKFRCHFCNYRTVHRQNLETHVRSHTGEKPYKCPLCLFKCSLNSHLHRHLRRKHVTGNGCKCPECGFTTVSTSKLLKHVKEAHVENCGRS